jgi:hypothetical protein
MRQLTAHAFITLPVMTAEETESLIRQLVAQTAGPNGTQVPHAIDDTFVALQAAGKTLGAAAPAPADGAGSSVKDAHHGVQVAWSLTERWLGGFAGLDADDDPRVPAARKLYGVLFGEGLGFANAKVEVEYERSERKIAAVQKAHLAREFEALGGKVFWTKLLAAHAAEGQAAHLTTAAPLALAVMSQQDAKLAAQNAVREYVAAVIGTVRASKPATQTLADKLLLPLTEWTADAPAPAAAPVPPKPAP